MEKEALNIALTRLTEALNVVELVTDESLTIKKLTSKSDHNLWFCAWTEQKGVSRTTVLLKKNSKNVNISFQQMILRIFSIVWIDVWHKSKSVRKCLAKVNACNFDKLHGI